VAIGYFSQDAGDMAGRSAVAEAMEGAGPASEVAAGLKELEAAMADPDSADPDRADEVSLIERYGEVQHRFLELDGYEMEGVREKCLAA
jgi:ATPase subunit of ABC transporter with duplicated ATPase domains